MGQITFIKATFTICCKNISKAPVQQIIIEKADVDLESLLIWHCHSEDVAPLITWGLVVTRGPYKNVKIWGFTVSRLSAKTE